MRLPVRPLRQARARFLVALVLLAALPPPAVRARWVGDFHVPGIDVRSYGQTVNKVICYGGGLVAGGSFAVADSSWAANVAQWNGTEWRPMGSGLSGGAVTTLALYEGQVVAAGAFTTSGAVSLAHVARWDGAQWQPLGDGLTDPVAALLDFDDGLYAASCTGTEAAAISRVSHWNGAEWTQFGPTFAGTVTALESYHGQVVAGLRRLNSDPARSSVVVCDGIAWTPLPGAVGDVKGLALWQGNLVIAGWHLGPATPPLGYVDVWDGLTLRTIGQGNPAPCSDAAYGLYCTPASLLVLHDSYCDAGRYSSGDIVINLWNGSAWSTIRTGMGGAVGMLDWGGRVVIHGQFASLGTVVSSGVVALNGTSIERIGLAGDGLVGAVQSLAARPDTLIAAGDFSVAGTVTTGGVAIRTSSGWWSAYGTGADSYRDINVALANPRGGYAWAGELVSLSYDSFFPCWDGGYIGSTWFWRGFGPEAIRINCLAWARGELAAGVQPCGDHSPVCYPLPGTCGGWTSVGPGLRGGPVYALTTFRDDLVAGGDGMTIDGETAGSLVAWDGQVWRSIGGPGGGVHALADLDSMLVAAGGSAADGFRCRVFSWRGSEWTPLGDPFPSGRVMSLASYRGRLYAGGDFLLGGGQTGGQLAQWNGQRWVAVPGAPDGAIQSMAVLNDRLYVGGTFSVAGGRLAANLACWEEPPLAVALGGFGASRREGTAEVAWTVAEGPAGVAFHLWSCPASPDGYDLTVRQLLDGTSFRS